MLTLLFCLMGEPVKLVYAAGYIPNVQFAPFYVALARGYYREADIDLELDYTMGPDVYKLVALNKVQIGSADSDAFLNAVIRDLPLLHVATLYQSYPIALIAREPILEPEKLRGKRVGISGPYGSSYLGLKAILEEMGMDLAQIQTISIGFTQVAALQRGTVDAVVGYINNEPIRLESLGVANHVRTPSTRRGFPGVGLMTNQTFYREHRDVVHAFLKATFRGMSDVLQDPETCYRLVVDTYLPQLTATERYNVEYRILQATLPFWTSDYVKQHGFGQCDPQAWQRLADMLNRDQAKDDYRHWRRWVLTDFTWQPTP